MPPTETVTVVPRADALEEFGCRTRPELDKWFRSQRALGRLVTERGRLTKRVRLPDGRRTHCCVVRGTAIPRRRRRRTRIFYW